MPKGECVCVWGEREIIGGKQGHGAVVQATLKRHNTFTAGASACTHNAAWHRKREGNRFT